jgi:hypothetical protein
VLYGEIIAVCSATNTKHINEICGKNAEFLNVKPAGTLSNYDAKGFKSVLPKKKKKKPTN